MSIEDLDHPDEVGERASKPVNFVNDHHVHRALILGAQPLIDRGPQRAVGPFERAAGEVGQPDCVAALFAGACVLGVEAVCVC